METRRFKTNINCTGCLSKVTPVLNEEGSIHQWDVDLEHEDRILTVKSSDLSAEEVEKTVSKAGFQAVQTN